MPDLSPYLAPAIALLAAAVAWAQWHTARSKLVLDLFNQRMAGIFYGDDGLLGEIAHQFDLLVGEGTDLLAIDGNRTDQLVFFQHRHADKCARAMPNEAGACVALFRRCARFARFEKSSHQVGAGRRGNKSSSIGRCTFSNCREVRLVGDDDLRSLDADHIGIFQLTELPTNIFPRESQIFPKIVL
jgi:hypothetical protein